MKSDTFNYAQLGLNIRTRRLEKHLTQSELARKAGCTAGTVSRLERGACSVSVKLLFDLADALICRASELVEGV